MSNMTKSLFVRRNSRLAALWATGLLALAAQSSLAADFRLASGDGEQACPSGSYALSISAAMTYEEQACKALNGTPSARLLGGGSISTVGGWCHVKHKDNSKQAATLCYSLPLRLHNQDNSCPAGHRLVTVQEAALFNAAACKALDGNQWHVARLAEGGSMGGAGYSCGIKAQEPQPLGNSLCTTAPLMDSAR